MKMSDRQRIMKILQLGKSLLQYVSREQITREVIQNNTTVQWTITTPLYNIGEHTNHISKELQAEHPEIPWRQVAGLRHRLVHDYEDTDWNIISESIFRGLPSYLEQLTALLAELPEN
jgi:uncharacterized protein with HEPN domain